MIGIFLCSRDGAVMGRGVVGTAFGRDSQGGIVAGGGGGGSQDDTINDAGGDYGEGYHIWVEHCPSLSFTCNCSACGIRW